MLVSGNKEKVMETEVKSGKMEESTLEHLKTTNCKELEPYFTPMVKNTLANL